MEGPGSPLTPRERFIMALEGQQPPGHVPTFELVFFLTMELLGQVHPTHRSFGQWDQMSTREQRLQVADCARVYIDTARHYGHAAIFVHAPDGLPDGEQRIAEAIRETSGNEFFLCCHGDTTLAVPGGDEMARLCYTLADEPQQVKDAQAWLADARLASVAPLAGQGLFDGYALCSDYCLNTGPFLSPAQFAEFVTPYLARLIAGYRELGFYTIKHTDGNIMPIIDQLVACRPHALHSLDPQAGVDIAAVKEQYGRQVCLIGNVNCGLLQTGTDEEVVASARYALQHGMPGGGYVFSTSNCVYTGMPLERYDLMMDVWRREGAY
ncbi:MAG TPA: uroporphyrinogen decarboxylase family protein [Anaerolineae bacterium]|nr:uroporphyrinogen decarboxylase family protein [Anaerolineae bacterium]HOQ98118.1 uroporphyrinogen decarboxylase family protein [Anaerolineae bacterium]